MQNQVDTWWHELNTWDPLEARNFYRRTLGWSFEKVMLPDGEPYWLARKDGKTVGGVYSMTAPEFKGIPAHWMTYMAVDDVQKAAQAAKAAGGDIARPAVDIPGIGTIAIVTDAAGALIGLIKPSPEHFDDHRVSASFEDGEFPAELAANDSATGEHPLPN
jgi:predicted enzyme related to lactoylglutathione lyase